MGSRFSSNYATGMNPAGDQNVPPGVYSLEAPVRSARNASSAGASSSYSSATGVSSSYSFYRWTSGSGSSHEERCERDRQDVEFPLGDLPMAAEAARSVVLSLQPGGTRRLREGAQVLAALEGSCQAWRQVVNDPFVWKTYICSKFGNRWPVPDGANPRHIYYRLHRLEESVTTFGIAWINTQYIQIVQCPGALGNRAVELMHVCWLDLQGTLTGVPAGIYQVVWRMAFKHVDLGYEPVNVEVCTLEEAYAAASHSSSIAKGDLVDSQGGTSGTSSRQGGERDTQQTSLVAGVTGSADEREPERRVVLHRSIPARLWSRIERERGMLTWVAVIVGTVKLERACTVRVRMWTHDGSWKSGVIWDSVRLEPVRMDPGVDEVLTGADSALTYHDD